MPHGQIVSLIRREPAKIRAFFVSPDHIGQKIGERILSYCETEATRRGFQSYELMATLTGARFYARHGYEGTDRVTFQLGEAGIPVDFIPMIKSKSI